MLKALLTVILLIASLAFVACSPAGEGETRTETISPAVPAPSAPSYDPDRTQTTEIGEERSPSEGGVLTTDDPGELEPPATTTTTTPPPAAKRD